MALKLVHNNNLVANLNVTATLGKSSFLGNPDESKFLSREQFRIVRDADGWLLEHLPPAVNSTICDGIAVTAPVRLQTGMIISVGNVAKKIEKFRLEVELDEVGKESIPAPLIVSDEDKLCDSVDNSEPLESALNDYDASSDSPDPTPIETHTPVKDADNPSAGGAILGMLLDFGLAIVAGAGSSDGVTKVYRGDSKYNDVILTIKDEKVHLGNSVYNEVVLLIKDNKIIRGSSIFGDAIAHRDGNKVIAGNNFFGDTIAIIDNEKVIEGTSSFFGNVIATVDGGGMMSATAAATYILLM